MADLELNSIGNGDGNNYLVRDNTKIPLSGTNALAGSIVPSTDNTYDLGSNSNYFSNIYSRFYCSGNSIDAALVSGNNMYQGGFVIVYRADGTFEPGAFGLYAVATNGSYSALLGHPNGTLSWAGQPIQYGSDARLKQQISNIDDKLLDAWEDVNLVQFKYNEAVEEKSDNARLHTGYIVQQIDEACQKHNVDVSKYGLYCHEEYAEETREIEHNDGTKTTEVVRPASEHYSLRYTEALIVECAYLRRENNRLKERLSKIEKLLNI